MRKSAIWIPVFVKLSNEDANGIKGRKCTKEEIEKVEMRSNSNT